MSGKDSRIKVNIPLLSKSFSVTVKPEEEAMLRKALQRVEASMMEMITKHGKTRDNVDDETRIRFLVMVVISTMMRLMNMEEEQGATVLRRIEALNNKIKMYLDNV